MVVLVICEESQAIANAYRSLGVEAYSCDLKPCSGGHPEYHLQMDCFAAFDIIQPDLLIAHPPCTYLSRAGACRLYPRKGIISNSRLEKGLEATLFFNRILALPVKRLCLENPIPMKIFQLPPPTQIIQPYMFGDPFTKTTYLWLKNLPPLSPTNILPPPYTSYVMAHRSAAIRSKTFPGIASAIAKQWRF